MIPGMFYSGWNGLPTAFGGVNGTQSSIPTWEGVDGLAIRRSLSNGDISSRIADTRSTYSTDPNYILNLLPEGYLDYLRTQNPALTSIAPFRSGLGATGNFGLGPVTGANFMFLGSRGARPEDNPESSTYKANAALRELGMASPGYNLPQAASPAVEGMGNLAKPATYGDPYSYVVATDGELNNAAYGRGSAAAGPSFGNMMKSANEWAGQKEIDAAQQRHESMLASERDKFANWAHAHRSDPMVVGAFGDIKNTDTPWSFREDAGKWFDANLGSNLVQKAIGSSQYPLLAPQYHLVDPSEGILNQQGTAAVQSDFQQLMAGRPSNAIRQQQAYNSISDGQWGGVLNPATYSRPDFRQITGQTNSPQFNSFGGWSGLGGLGGMGAFGWGTQQPTMATSGMATGVTYNPNPWAQGGERAESPWGGPWGGR